MQDARKHNATYKLTYEEPILLSNLTRHMADLFQEFTQSGGVRPFGVSVLLAGVDQLGAKLYQLDPSGVFHEWKAVAIGRNSQTIKQILEWRYKDGIDFDEAVHIGLTALREKFEGLMSSSNIEIAFVDMKTSKFQMLPKNQIQNAIEFLRE